MIDETLSNNDDDRCPDEINEDVCPNENGMNKVRITKYNQYKTVDCL